MLIYKQDNSGFIINLTQVLKFRAQSNKIYFYYFQEHACEMEFCCDSHAKECEEKIVSFFCNNFKTCTLKFACWDCSHTDVKNKIEI